MIFKLALRNIIGNGWRSLINIGIIAAVLISLIWMEAMWYSWLVLAKTQQKQWEFASGMLRSKNYDPYDTFSWEKSYAPIPAEVLPHVESGDIVPILYAPSVIYPGGRQLSAMVKGIPAGQKVLELPSSGLAPSEDGPIPALIGKNMARTTKLGIGDVFTLRVKDSAGAFNAVDLQITDVMDSPVPSLDIGTVWVDLSALREARLLTDVATVLVLKEKSLQSVSAPQYELITEKEFFADLNEMVMTKAVGQSVLFLLMIFLAMLAIFDTQALAIFKRRKEIGMLSALGMTKGQITRMFTLEGALYMVFAAIASLVLGFPLFWYFATKGFALPGGVDFGVVGFDRPLKFVYPLPLILLTLVLMFILTAFVSWLPVRKIAALKTVDALKGGTNA
ncbi:MAG: FtsX-like permease family protein [Candidatus Cloacimonetes bacterium]|nr:FtsX-like permease family protein [Candidatus Cloacimonadota bacterium]